MSSSRWIVLPLLTSAILANASLSFGRDVAAEATTSVGPRTPAVKTITSFSQALRCMDELFLAFGKQGIVITSAGIPDQTGKVKTGDKDMVIKAISDMTKKSKAFYFIDFHSQGDDLGNLFNSMGDRGRSMPDYYIRGGITSLDDNAVRKNKGAGFSLPFLDFGYSKDESYDVMTMDMSIGEAATRRILPETSTSNTMVIVKGGKSGEGGGRLGKIGLSFNLDLSRSEGTGASARTLLELGLIETLGKFTQVPYWRCLDTDLTNPLLRSQALENYETMTDKDRILFIQRKLGGSMKKYRGPIDGMVNDDFKNAVQEYQNQVGLIANGAINFDLYASLLDDTQNILAAMPTTPSASAYIPGASAAVPAPPPVAVVASAPSSSAPPFTVSLDSDRGTKPNYKVGELLRLNLSINGHGTAYCYYEDVDKATARLFPNRFHGDPKLRAGEKIQFPNGAFKMEFQKPGRERIVCIGADREIIAPSWVNGAPDLRPLGRGLDDIVNQFKQANPTAVSSVVDITVSPR